MGGSGDGEETLQGLSCRKEERILVSVRLRPLNEKEASRKEAIDWECINDTTIIYKNNSSPERSLYPNTFTFGKKLILFVNLYHGYLWLLCCIIMFNHVLYLKCIL